MPEPPAQPAQPSRPVPPKVGLDLPEGAETPEGAASYTVSQIYYNNAEGIPFAVFPPVAIATPAPPTEEIFASPRFPEGNPNQGVRTTGGIRKGDRRPEGPITPTMKPHIGVYATAVVQVPGDVFGQQMMAVEGTLIKVRVKGPQGASLSLRIASPLASEVAATYEFGPLLEGDLESPQGYDFREGARLEFWTDAPGEFWFSAIGEGKNL
jgi:hypothetical protein